MGGLPMKITSVVVSVVIAVIAAAPYSFAADFGQVSGQWEAKGHWQTAGSLGIICEQRDLKKKKFKVKVYQKEGHLYQEFKDLRFWPNSCSDVTTGDLQNRWGNLGTIVEDVSFVPDGGEKGTKRRWRIQ